MSKKGGNKSKKDPKPPMANRGPKVKVKKTAKGKA